MFFGLWPSGLRRRRERANPLTFGAHGGRSLRRAHAPRVGKVCLGLRSGAALTTRTARAERVDCGRRRAERRSEPVRQRSGQVGYCRLTSIAPVAPQTRNAAWPRGSMSHSCRFYCAASTPPQVNLICNTIFIFYYNFDKCFFLY